jgi:hypothetical protein
MVGAEMVKGGWSRNELGEVIQNGVEKRKSRDQGNHCGGQSVQTCIYVNQIVRKC